jgi:hypothetical protein
MDVNPELLEEALEIAGEKSRGKVVDRALAEFIRRRRLDELRALRGKIDIEDNLDELKRLELEKMRKSW